MALFNPSLLDDLKKFLKNQSILTQISPILDTAITKEIGIIKSITQPNDTIASALTNFHIQQNKKRITLKEELDTFFKEKYNRKTPAGKHPQ